jgi:hypothetical protein
MEGVFSIRDTVGWHGHTCDSVLLIYFFKYKLVSTCLCQYYIMSDVCVYICAS